MAKAIIQEVIRADKTLNVTVDYFDDKGVLIVKRAFNFQDLSTITQQDIIKTVTDEGLIYISALSNEIPLKSNLEGMEIKI